MLSTDDLLLHLEQQPNIDFGLSFAFSMSPGDRMRLSSLNIIFLLKYDVKMMRFTKRGSDYSPNESNKSRTDTISVLDTDFQECRLGFQ